MSFPGIIRRLFTNNGAGPLLRGDIIPPSYGTCSTAAGTAAKTVSIPGITLKTGVEITVRFSVTNTAANPTLNLNSTGAKAIRYRNTAISAGYLAANRTYRFVYDGTYWQLVGDVDTNTTYTAATAAPKAPGTAAVGTSAKYAREDHVHPVQTSVSGSSGSCTGNAATSTKLATARTILVNLASTTAASFDGTENATPGVSGTLPVGRGGTGRTDGKAVALATKRTISLTGDATGSVGFDGSANAAIPASIPALVPVGGIVAFSGTFSGRNPVDMKSKKAMTNWCLCDGTTTNGLAVPDLRDRMIMGAGTTYESGAKGGAATHTHSISGTVGETTLTVEQIASHGHTYNFQNSKRDCAWDDDPNMGFWLNTKTATTGSSGGSQPHTHSLAGIKSGNASTLPPYYALAYIMRTV